MTTKPIVRCAIYTRKSSEEGLEQDFNSLHAQREASEAFIKSQKHEGWQVINTAYDDGGYSGGTMNRPALQSLMDDISAEKIDVIVVYKVDRLSRSLHDFAKMVELFDQHKVSFVSVTQQFNTTSSMGRLTLNVLLSFAQFEREVTGERIRDKIAASKRKGMWMGGHVPLGYDLVDRKLVANPVEAETIHLIFTRYLALGSVRLLKEDIDARGIRSKTRIRKDGTEWVGCPFSRGGLYQLLSNPIYIGKIRHKDAWHEGEHAPIIEQAVWDEVQHQLKTNGPLRLEQTRKTEASLLTGKLFDASGDYLAPSHAVKKGKRYRYYVSRRLLTDPTDKDGTGWRLPAHEAEQMVLRAVKAMLSDHAVLADMITMVGASPQQTPGLLQIAANILQQIDSTADHTNLFAHVIQRVELKRDSVNVKIILAADTCATVTIAQDIPMQLRRRGVEIRLVLGDGSQEMKGDPSLIKAIARARIWFEELASGRTASMSDIARREAIDKGYISNLLKLAFLSPDIVDTIIAGKQEVELTAQSLSKNIEISLNWSNQLTSR